MNSKAFGLEGRPTLLLILESSLLSSSLGFLNVEKVRKRATMSQTGVQYFTTEIPKRC